MTSFVWKRKRQFWVNYLVTLLGVCYIRKRRDDNNTGTDKKVVNDMEPGISQ